jgi:hypothetical protein
VNKTTPTRGGGVQFTPGGLFDTYNSGHRVRSDDSTSDAAARKAKSEKRRFEEFTEEFQEMLEEAGVLLDGRERIGLQTTLGPLCAAPWELAFSPARLMPWRGPSSAIGEDVRRFANLLREERRKAVSVPSQPQFMRSIVLQPLSSQDLESASIDDYWRLRESSQRINAVEEYRRFDPNETAVLHVAGSFSETSDYSELILTGKELSPSYFTRFLGGLSRWPTIFLNVPPCRNPSEQMH